MVPVVTTLSATDLLIDWIAPNSGSLSIQSYLIEILSSDGITYYQAPTCDGTNSYIITNTFCKVPMLSLTKYPFMISQGTLIQVRISASNSLGFSIPSTLNS